MKHNKFWKKSTAVEYVKWVCLRKYFADQASQIFFTHLATNICMETFLWGIMGSVDFALHNTLWIFLIGGVVDKILEFFKNNVSGR